MLKGKKGSGLTVIQMTGFDVKVLSGQWPTISFSFHQKRTPDHDVKKELNKILSKLPSGLKRFVLIISRHDTVLKEFELPSNDSREISRMLGLQIPSIIPFDQTQSLYRYRTTSGGKAGYTRALAAVVPNNVIQKYGDALPLEAVMMKDVFLSVDTCQAFITHFLKNNVPDETTAAFLFSGERSSELIFSGEEFFSYYIPFGHEDLPDQSGGLAKEIKRCLADYKQRHPEAAPGKVFSELNAAEVSELQKEFSSQSIEVVSTDFFASVPEPARSFIRKEGLNASWISLLGSFSADEKKLMSFLPEKIHFSKIRQQNTKILAVFICSLIGMFLAGGALLTSGFYKYENYLKSVQRQVKLLEPRLENIEQETEFLSVITRKSFSFSTLEMMKEIFGMIPDDVSLQYLAMRSSEKFELQGTALEDQSLSRLQAALVSSEYFHQVDLQYATRRKRFNREYTEFKITFEKAE